MHPKVFHRRVQVFCLIVVLLIWAAALASCSAFAAPPGEQFREQYVPKTPEEWWGTERWQQIMQYYYPHDHKNGMWFNRKQNCCGGKDCFPARSGTVKWTPDGFRVVMPDGGWAIVNEEKVPWNPDDVPENRALVCLIDMGVYYKSDSEGKPYSGDTYYNTQWRIRPNCFWGGRLRG